MRPRVCALGGWRCRVGEVVGGRRILYVSRLGVCDARRGRGCGRGMRKRRRLGVIAWALVQRKVMVVAHSNGLAR